MTARTSRRGAVFLGGLICAALVVLAPAASPALAGRTLLNEEALEIDPREPATEGWIEGACGLAVSPDDASLWVSDYYNAAVRRFSVEGALIGGAAAAVTPPEGPCGLALDSAENLYANIWHERVVRLLPTVATIDEESSTGVAVDAAGNLYVDDRTYIAEYEAPVDPGDAPVRQIGLGSLGDAYGVAVAGGKVYVPDAVDDTVKIYEPATSLSTPVETIAGFVSLVDAAVAIDPSNGHLLVADNSQPGFTHPEAAIREFDADGEPLGTLPGEPIDGEPTGLAAASDGTLYVTDGNDEGSNVFEYSPYSAPAQLVGGSGAPSDSASVMAVGAGGTGPGMAASASASPNGASPGLPLRHAGSSNGQAQLVRQGPIRIAVDGGLTPTRLPRKGAAPISVTIGGRISTAKPDEPPQLRKVSFAFNRAGRLDTEGLPRCTLADIDPSTTRQALETCRSSVVGEGQFSANVRLPEQSPFPSAGKVLAFNGTLHGKRVVFAHIYGEKPVPTSVVLPLEIHQDRGVFGTRLDASLSTLTGDWGYVTGIDLRLGRKYRFHGERHSFLSAGCPAPKGFPGALFPLTRTTFSFVGGRTLTATLIRDCTVR